MQLLFYLLLFVGGYFIIYLFNLDAAGPGRSLSQKFISLGIMSGKHMNDIIDVVGPPNSRSPVGNKLLLQWIATGYHISIMFDENGFYEKITSETNVS